MSPQARFTELMREHFADLPISIIEIGTASGLWTEYVVRNYPAVEKLYTIDPYRHLPDEKYEGGRPQEWHDHIKSVAIKRLNGFPNVNRYSVPVKRHYLSSTIMRLFSWNFLIASKWRWM